MSIDTVPLEVISRFAAEHPYYSSIKPDTAPDELTASRFIDPFDALSAIALRRWWQHKQVYRFSLELVGELTDDTEDMEVPVEALYNLPAPCIYVPFPWSPDIHGFFAAVLTLRGIDHLVATIIYKDGQLAPVLLRLLRGRTLSQVIRYHVNQHQEMSGNASFSNAIGDQLHAFWRWALPLIQYLCADNAELRQRSKPRPDRDGVKLPPKPLVYEVGADFAVAYRKFVKAQRAAPADPSGAAHTGRSPRPHMRRGHYHHFWTGPRSDPSARKLVLHWLGPILVGEGDGRVVTVNLADKQK